MKTLKTILLATLLCLVIAKAQALDTIRIMHYNLLVYGVNAFGCNNTNNNVADKNQYLRTILAHDMPDIFTVNEISRTSSFHDKIIEEVFEHISPYTYARASNNPISTSSFVNQVYFNTNKFALKSQRVLQWATRDIDLYRLYYRSPDLEHGDTVFVNLIVAHLKAGSSASDVAARGTMVKNALDQLSLLYPPGNYLFLGDLNLYNSSEIAMQHLLNNPKPAYRFFDPVNQLGEWTSNPAFANFHTQSTQIQSDCHSGGGLDDRFDFILASRAILEGSDKVQYIEDSYHTLGQDGLRFNKALLSLPANFSAPETVIEALAANSDHLPILLSLAIDQTPAATRDLFYQGALLATNNPINDNLRIYHRNIPLGTPFELTVYTITGTSLQTISDTLHSNPQTIGLSHLSRGFYLIIIRLQNTTGAFKVIKL